MNYLLDIAVTFLKGFGVLGGILAILAIFVFWLMFPLVAVWALNTLFGLHIAYTFETWIASLILISIFHKRTEITTE
jgi:hypothetical protein